MVAAEQGVGLSVLPTLEANRFAGVLAHHGHSGLRRTERTRVLQVNLGKLCNQACSHCHVEAGPKRTEIMSRSTVDQVLALLDRSPDVGLADLTGGAPELNPSFRYFVTQLRLRHVAVMVRCNLTVLLEQGQEDTPDFFAAHGIHVVSSLPCYSEENVDKQRGGGVFERSIEGLQRLNAMGYGRPSSGLRLDLVYNPGGAFLPPAQDKLEVDYKRVLHEDYGIVFNTLLCLANMPINRFDDWLRRQGAQESYMALLEASFNAATVPGLMCRDTLSVGWDGRLYDCDFNQMLELCAPGLPDLAGLSSLEELSGRPIATGSHCLGCTAGSGSSCGGSLS